MTAGSDDDWAPLPADAQCAHPGELAMLAKRELPPAPLPTVAEAKVLATPEPKVVVAPLPPTPPAAEPEPEDPAVLKALAALRAKIASAPAPTSMVAEVQERLRRAERRQQRRQQAPPADLQSAVVRVAADEATTDGSIGAATNGIVVGRPVLPVGPTPTAPQAAAPTAPVVGAGDRTAELTGELAVEHDEREDSEWFRQLPATEQQRLHKVWAEKRASAARAASNVRRNGNERLVAGLLVFVAVMLLGTRVNWHATLGAGIVCGIWWRHARADRFLDPLRAFVAMAVLQVLAMLVNGYPSPQLFMDAPLLIAFAALVGFDGEMRRTGGFDVR